MSPMVEEKAVSRALQLRRKIESRQARVGIAGLGYVGLPLAAEFARAGFSVTGIDIDSRKVDSLNRGDSYIKDVSPAALKALLARAGRRPS